MHCSRKLHCSFLPACVYNKYLVCLCARKGRYHENIIMYLLPLSSSLLLATIHFRPGSFYRTNIMFYPFSFPFVSISMPNFSFLLFSLLSSSLSFFPSSALFAQMQRLSFMKAKPPCVLSWLSSCLRGEEMLPFPYLPGICQRTRLLVLVLSM